MMLGTGRSGVTIAIGTLQQAGFIRSVHGTMRSSIAAASKTQLANAMKSRITNLTACSEV